MTEIEYLSIWIDEILEALKRVSRTEVIFISDLSYVGEVLEDDEVEAISRELGVPVDPHDLFIDVAKRLKKARE